LGESIPAVGFSIGFERLCASLLEQKYEIPSQKKKFAVIYNEENFTDALRYADSIRGEYDVAMYQSIKKLGKLFSKLEESGFYGCRVMGQDEVKYFKK
ncbi:MAG: histidine--tRNA ligase, partial [Eubacteriales bacterium]